MTTNKSLLLTIAVGLTVFVIVMRLLPHEPNMTPVTAAAIVGGLYLGRRWAFLLPSLALLISDMLVGFYDWKIMLSVYASFALISGLSLVVAKYRSVLIGGISLIGASTSFFLITNGAVWAFSPWYEKSVSGLMYAYELGLPFFRNMLLGDVVYTLAMVAVFELVIVLTARPTFTAERAQTHSGF